VTRTSGDRRSREISIKSGSPRFSPARGRCARQNDWGTGAGARRKDYEVCSGVGSLEDFLVAPLADSLVLSLADVLSTALLTASLAYFPRHRLARRAARCIACFFHLSPSYPSRSWLHCLFLPRPKPTLIIALPPFDSPRCPPIPLPHHWCQK
jgi:hypothetical protein